LGIANELVDLIEGQKQDKKIAQQQQQIQSKKDDE
jgi:hypothetical protein